MQPGACISELTWGGGAEDIPHVLVGNKSDLVHEREVAPEEGQRLADEWGVAFIKSSAKFNTNVEEVYLPCRSAAVARSCQLCHSTRPQNTDMACMPSRLSFLRCYLADTYTYTYQYTKAYTYTCTYTYSYILCVWQVFRKLIATCEARTEASDHEKKCVVM